MKNTKILWIVVVVVAIALIVLSILRTSSKEEDTINIGMISPLTGSFAVNGEQARNAALLAVDQINSNGGIMGKKVNIIVEDGKCDAAATLSAWNKLVKTDKVRIVVGGHCSTETLTIAPLASTTQTLVLANITSAVQIANEGDWLFRHSPPSSYIAVKAGEYAVKSLNYKTIGIISEKKEFPQTYTQHFKDSVKALGASITYQEEFLPGTTDFRSIILKIKNSKVDAVLVSTQGGSTAGLIAKQFRDLGLEPVQIYNAGFDLKSFKDGTTGYIPAKFIVVTGYADPNDETVRSFIAAYESKYNSKISFNLYYISAVYDIVMRAKDSMIACKSTENINCIRDQFKTATSYKGISGTVQVSSTYAPQSSIMPLGILTVDDMGNALVKSIEIK